MAESLKNAYANQHLRSLHRNTQNISRHVSPNEIKVSINSSAKLELTTVNYTVVICHLKPVGRSVVVLSSVGLGKNVTFLSFDTFSSFKGNLQSRAKLKAKLKAGSRSASQTFFQQASSSFTSFGCE